MTKKIVINILISISVFLSLATIASAQLLDNTASDLIRNNATEIQRTSGLGTTTIGSIIATIIKACLGLLAAIFLVLMIVAGFQWMTAAGNETKVEKAVGMIKTAVIGLIIVLAAYSITYFIFTYLPFSGNGLTTK